jgi:chromosome segregation ATPase
MEQKDSKIFSKEIMQAVSAFCESKEIKDVDNFMYLCFKQGFDIRKYGLLGKTLNEVEKDLIKEVIVEKRVEVPVEVIKEIEVIKEVPIDRVVEKIIYTTDDNQINELGEKNAKLEIELLRNSEQLNELLLKIQQLEEEISTKTTEIGTIRKEFSTKTTEMENNFQNEMSMKEVELQQLKISLEENLNNEKLKLLQQTIQNLRGELQQKNEQIKELEKINRELLNGNQNQAYLLRGSNLNRRL